MAASQAATDGADIEEEVGDDLDLAEDEYEADEWDADGETDAGADSDDGEEEN